MEKKKKENVKDTPDAILFYIGVEKQKKTAPNINNLSSQWTVSFHLQNSSFLQFF